MKRTLRSSRLKIDWKFSPSYLLYNSAIITSLLLMSEWRTSWNPRLTIRLRGCLLKLPPHVIGPLKPTSNDEIVKFCENSNYLIVNYSRILDSKCKKMVSTLTLLVAILYPSDIKFRCSEFGCSFGKTLAAVIFTQFVHLSLNWTI